MSEPIDQIMDVERLTEENTRLREILKLFADPDNWSTTASTGQPAWELEDLPKPWLVAQKGLDGK
jgi:hypothetical protein